MITEDLTIKYKIPEEYLKMIDDAFLTLMMKKLFFYDATAFDPECSIDERGEIIKEEDVARMDDGTIIFNELYLEGTGIWYDTLKEVCEVFNKQDLLKYYNSLPWYDSDLFDDQFGTMMAKKVVEKQEWKEKNGK